MAWPDLRSRSLRFVIGCGRDVITNDDNILDDADAGDNDGCNDDAVYDDDGGYDDDEDGDDDDGGDDLQWRDYARSIVILLQGNPWCWQGLD